jgi:hypothetical protein
MPSGEPGELMQRNWSPSVRLFAYCIGGAVIVRGISRRTPGACVMGMLGTCLILRAAGLFQRSCRRSGEAAQTTGNAATAVATTT